ncbi:MAG: hypothetical protein QOI88_3269 [Gammaproteobacteria bacterium]|jgi:hypothetical protein|nr:hypothetical protein [Gammaproteobacteria bacterium]
MLVAIVASAVIVIAPVTAIVPLIAIVPVIIVLAHDAVVLAVRSDDAPGR